MSQNWQQNALEDLLRESVREQRRRRRWGIFFKLVFIVFVIVALVVIFGSSSKHSGLQDKPHTALIDIRGTIAAGGEADADRIATSLNHAFKDKGTKGVILRINSGGGSPVQSDYVYNELRRLEHKYPKIKVYAVCSDICASGAYYIASAANDIYADPSSLVGSIGVITGGFGFVDGMKKLGITRRVLTAGNQKAFMDPYKPLKPTEVKEMHVMLDQLHGNFIKAVKDGRGDRLKVGKDTFSGRIWTGTQAKQMGLIDDFGSSGFVARNVIKQDKIINYTIKPNMFERFARQVGASASADFTKRVGLDQTISVR
tara:strand:- start:19621 stop:20562 length:942 start_codon:yes stop_codon:yes gene_type:complete